MKVFITGASGYIGSAVAQKLKSQGHLIFALARSVESANQFKELGYTVIRGDMQKPEQWLWFMMFPIKPRVLK